MWARVKVLRKNNENLIHDTCFVLPILPEYRIINGNEYVSGRPSVSGVHGEKKGKGEAFVLEALQNFWQSYLPIIHLRLADILDIAILSVVIYKRRMPRSTRPELVFRSIHSIL